MSQEDMQSFRTFNPKTEIPPVHRKAFDKPSYRALKKIIKHALFVGTIFVIKQIEEHYSVTRKVHNTKIGKYLYEVINEKPVKI